MSNKHPLSDLKNIDKEHKRNRLIVFTVLVLSFSFAGYTFFTSNSLVEDNRSKIYTLVNGNALLLATRKDAQDNRPAEVRHHIKMFMELLFTLSPDKSQIEQNISQALYLGDNSIKQFRDRLQEQKYYDKLISSNASQTIKLDSNSIQVDYANYPYLAIVKVQQEIIRPSTITIKELTCTMTLRNISRSDNNPHGLLIEKFEVPSNNTIQTYDRSAKE
ncbi:MAG: conjugative transposon protein TraK [Daejeonella sp.]